MSRFQIILTAVFVVCIILGVALFATYKNKSSQSTLPTIEIWGTFPQSTFTTLLQKLNSTRVTPIYVNYTEISKSNFNSQFIQELARGRGPDAILISQEEILRYYDKIIQIPNTVLTQRDFQNTYVPQANLYLTGQGTLAIPFTIDPLVMYWNRDSFTNAGLVTYPHFWDEFSQIISRITIKDVNSNIRRSAIALGEFQNITHAREILSTFFLQAGNPITLFSDTGLNSVLGDSQFSGSKLSTSALSFFVQFSDPRNQQYSWNRSLPSSKNTFLSGNLATYFGFTSELTDLRQKNPNIDFDVAPLPQARNGKNRVTYANMYAFSIVRSTKNPTSTYTILNILTAPDSLNVLNQLIYLPSVRRDVVANGSTDPYMAIFLDSALISKGWLDIDTARSNRIFTNLVESVTSGSADISNAIKDASDELDISLKSQ